ncbi:MAG: carbohydrate ABC transporter permease [Gammaproteobacteria bacterium]|nr:carbohydrate ABC transporter permease [Gammaproteobacteria bacterium]NNJ97026.1 carbohydrate ABC transporter permease [Gammaproteobacteria bacterium]
MTRSTWLTSLLAYAVLCGIAFLFLLPILMMLSGSLKPDERVLIDTGTLAGLVPVQPTIENYQDVFARVPFLRYLFNSTLITSSIVVAGLLVNSLAAYAFARLRWPWRDKLLFGVIALMIIPLEAIAVPLFYQVTLLGWRDTYLVQIVPFIANAFSIYLFYSFFIGFPRELEEAARIDGAGPFRIFFTIVVPNAKPVFASVAILTFLTQWGSFLWPLMVTHSENVRPLPLGIAAFYTLPPLQWGDIFAFGVMMVAPVLLIFVLLQRWFVEGVATTGVKG